MQHSWCSQVLFPLFPSIADLPRLPSRDAATRFTRLPGPQRHNREETRAEMEQTRVTCDTLLAGVCVGLAGPEQHWSLRGRAILTGKELAGGRTWGHGPGEPGLVCPACITASELPSSRKMRSYWRESSAGLRG